MQRTILIAGLLVLGVAGCAVRVGPPETIMVGGKSITVSGGDGFDPVAVRRPDPHNPNVFVTEAQTIVVDQEPVRPTVTIGGTVYIAWALNAQSDYSFPDKRSITFIAGTGNPLPDNFDCLVRTAKKKVILCWYDKPSQPQMWKYAIRVVDKSGNDLTKLDPWVHQP
jgi:hypothetical protein